MIWGDALFDLISAEVWVLIFYNEWRWYQIPDKSCDGWDAAQVICNCDEVQMVENDICPKVRLPCSILPMLAISAYSLVWLVPSAACLSQCCGMIRRKPFHQECQKSPFHTTLSCWCPWIQEALFLQLLSQIGQWHQRWWIPARVACVEKRPGLASCASAHVAQGPFRCQCTVDENRLHRCHKTAIWWAWGARWCLARKSPSRTPQFQKIAHWETRGQLALLMLEHDGDCQDQR